jgi:hypothetical protein
MFVYKFDRPKSVVEILSLLKQTKADEGAEFVLAKIQKPLNRRQERELEKINPVLERSIGQ